MNEDDVKEILTWNHGLMAVTHSGIVFHFVLFPEDPSDSEIEEIKKEINNDPEFGVNDLPFNLFRMNESWIEKAKGVVGDLLEKLETHGDDHMHIWRSPDGS